MFTFEAYIDREGRLCLRPLNPDGEEKLRNFVKKYKEQQHDALDVETEMSNDRYRQYEQQQEHRRNYGSPPAQYYNPLGYGPQSYIAMPPDFSPQSHYIPPFLWPLWFQGDDGQYGRQGRSSRDGRSANPLGRGRDERFEDEDPRDLGRRDNPSR